MAFTRPLIPHTSHCTQRIGEGKMRVRIRLSYFPQEEKGIHGNLLIYFGIHVSQLYGRTEKERKKIFSVNGEYCKLDDCIRKKISKNPAFLLSLGQMWHWFENSYQIICPNWRRTSPTFFAMPWGIPYLCVWYDADHNPLFARKGLGRFRMRIFDTCSLAIN